MDLLSSLNPPQREAVQAVEGPVLVIAGPGSGKTRVIVNRIAYLVQTCGVRPSRILAVTFTNKAAREMRERVAHLLSGEGAEFLSLGTFHSIGARLLRIEAETAGLDRSFAIYDSGDQLSLVKRVMEELRLDSKKYGASQIQHTISSAKSMLLNAAQFAETVGNDYERRVADVYAHYEQLLHRSNALDFDDLIFRVVKLLENKPEVLTRYQERYVHVLVDEFQDTNLAQYRMARLISGKHRNLCVVGDPDQSIYSWREADVGNILNFERDYPDARVVKLEQNYRSTKTILEAAGKVIAKNQDRHEKELWTENAGGLPILIANPSTELDEARFVVEELERLVKEGRYRYGDCAVLYRTNAQSRPLEESFVRYGLPYHLVGALRYYERREVKDVLAYLRLINNPSDDVSFQRIVNVPARGIGERSLDELTQWSGAKGFSLFTAAHIVVNAQEGERPPVELGPRVVRALKSFLELLELLAQESRQGPVAELVEKVVKLSGYRDFLLASDDNGEERLENVLELQTVAAQYAHLEFREGLEAFLENVALVSDTDNLGNRPNSTTLITLHQAKGLEFPVVFMVGMEEGVLPHIRSFDDPSEMEEERRLCYVGMTRARERLYLLRAYRRSAMGTRSVNPPSRFLADIPKHLVRSPHESAPAPLRSGALGRVLPAVRPTVALAFRAGDRVKHTAFGEGVVVNCVASAADQEVTVAFNGTAGLKRLLLSFAPLEKVS